MGFLEWWSEFAPEVHYTKNEGKPGYFPPFDDRKTDNRIGQGAGTHWRVLGSLGLQPEHVWGCSLDARGEGSCVPAHIQPRRPDLEQASAGPTRSPCRHSTSPSVRPTSSLTRSRGRTASPTQVGLHTASCVKQCIAECVYDLWGGGGSEGGGDVWAHAMYTMPCTVPSTTPCSNAPCIAPHVLQRARSALCAASTTQYASSTLHHGTHHAVPCQVSLPPRPRRAASSSRSTMAASP